MKKVLVTTSLLLFIAVNYFTVNVFAETGIDVIRASATAMNFAKLKEFNTMQIRATVYAQNQRVGIRVMSKGDDLLRFEQTIMGRDEIYVLTEDAFFQLKPVFKELDKEDALSIMILISRMMPTMMFGDVDSLNEEKVSIELIGIEKFNGKDAKKVRMTPKESPETVQYLYFDAITNWLLGVDLTSQVSLVYEKMKRLKGYVYPAVIKLMVDGKKQQEIEINKLEADIDLPDSLFERP